MGLKSSISVHPTIHFYQLPSEGFTIEDELKERAAVANRKDVEESSSFPYGVMHADGIYNVSPPIPVEAVGKGFMGFVVTPESDGD